MECCIGFMKFLNVFLERLYSLMGFSAKSFDLGKFISKKKKKNYLDGYIFIAIIIYRINGERVISDE